jgi:hypothetical protein
VQQFTWPGLVLFEVSLNMDLPDLHAAVRLRPTCLACSRWVWGPWPGTRGRSAASWVPRTEPRSKCIVYLNQSTMQLVGAGRLPNSQASRSWRGVADVLRAASAHQPASTHLPDSSPAVLRDGVARPAHRQPGQLLLDVPCQTADLRAAHPVVANCSAGLDASAVQSADWWWRPRPNLPPAAWLTATGAPRCRP